VADRMGEKAPRLYRHVDALVAEGLLELVEEKPKRGTVERYYRTVASRFEVDPGLFSTTSGKADAAAEMLRSVFRSTESELLGLFQQQDESESEPDHIPFVMRLAVRGTPQEIKELRQKLADWMTECRAISEAREDTPDTVSYTGLLAFYPQADNE